MSSTIYEKGSPKPPASGGKLRIYARPMSIWLEKVQILLNALNIPYDTVLISYDSTPEWYNDVQSEGKIPALDTGNEVITDMTETIRFLLNKNPDSKIVDKQHKEADKALLEKFHKADEIYRDALLSRKADSVEQYYKEIETALKSFVSELKKRGTPYLGGNSPGIADFLIWPTAERIRVLSRVFDKELPQSSGDDDMDLVRKWKDGIIQEKSVDAVKLDVDQFVNLVKAEFKK